MYSKYKKLYLETKKKYIELKGGNIDNPSNLQNIINIINNKQSKTLELIFDFQNFLIIETNPYTHTDYPDPNLANNIFINIFENRFVEKKNNIIRTLRKICIFIVNFLRDNEIKEMGINEINFHLVTGVHRSVNNMLISRYLSSFTRLLSEVCSSLKIDSRRYDDNIYIDSVIDLINAASIYAYKPHATSNMGDCYKEMDDTICQIIFKNYIRVGKIPIIISNDFYRSSEQNLINCNIPFNCTEYIWNNSNNTSVRIGEFSGITLSPPIDFLIYNSGIEANGQLCYKCDPNFGLVLLNQNDNFRFNTEIEKDSNRVVETNEPIYFIKNDADSYYEFITRSAKGMIDDNLKKRNHI